MKFLTKIIIIFISIILFGNISFAQSSSDEKALNTLATDPSKCGSFPDEQGRLINPRNCLFLYEPIGGKAGYDLYTVKCIMDPHFKEPVCIYELWNGGSIQEGVNVEQAILTETPGKEYEGPFGLLYSYLSLIYAYMSGLIVGIAVLFIVMGGIQISMSGGEESKVTEGKNRIKKAIIGIILWFTASIILYTINPTFFVF